MINGLQFDYFNLLVMLYYLPDIVDLIKSFVSWYVLIKPFPLASTIFNIIFNSGLSIFSKALSEIVI